MIRITLLLAVLVSVLATRVAYADTTNGWDKGVAGTGNIVQLAAGKCAYLNLVVGDTATTFSKVLAVDTGAWVSIEYNPDTAGATLGPSVYMYRCDAPGSNVTNECRQWDVDRDGDGFPDLAALTGANGYIGWRETGTPAAVTVQIVGVGATHRVKVCTGK